MIRKLLCYSTIECSRLFTYLKIGTTKLSSQKSEVLMQLPGQLYCVTLHSSLERWPGKIQILVLLRCGHIASKWAVKDN